MSGKGEGTHGVEDCGDPIPMLIAMSEPAKSELTPETECWKYEYGETPHCRWCGRPKGEREFLGPREHNPSCPINAVVGLRAALADSGKEIAELKEQLRRMTRRPKA